MDGMLERRRLMVDMQIQQRGIVDQQILDAFLQTPREEFVPEEEKAFAYDDSSLPINEGQTISQPYIVALMTANLQLKPTDKVLEIGTGSGYGAAILSRIAAEVYTVERYPSLAKKAQEVFNKLGYDNIHVLCGDGSLGWPEYAPYDAISITASSPEIPFSLLKQLSVAGRLVIPVGPMYGVQELVRVSKEKENDYSYKDLCPVRFVPLVGKEGWQPSQTI